MCSAEVLRVIDDGSWNLAKAIENLPFQDVISKDIFKEREIIYLFN